jgi:hypothetical protein
MLQKFVFLLWAAAVVVVPLGVVARPQRGVVAEGSPRVFCLCSPANRFL